ncbi:hypothetical protein Psi01_60000 [Planobispora siamensis]|uniref:Uncharacterized protein n=1 Tax=Planobispora siamensis TaxID=936338 RepID=A0A8J3SLI4_9ACTN|nr:hypothetical protein Psi01_60000 [Planobispora siamensis]
MGQVTRALAPCHCRRYDVACGRIATQEDLLCDTCRDGCSRISLSRPGAPPSTCPENAHVRVMFGFDISASGTSAAVASVDGVIVPPQGFEP